MDKAQQIYKKYKSNLTAIYLAGLFLYFVLSAILDYIGLFPLVILAGVSIAVILWKLTIFKVRKNILGVVIDDLDAPLYREVVRASGFYAQNLFYAMDAEFYVGNIPGAIAIGEAVCEDSTLFKKYGYAMLPFLAQYYYCLGDDEGLASVCRRFRELRLPRLKTKKVRKMTGIINKYETYLAGDYDSFVRPIDPKSKGTIYPFITYFNEARAALKRGDINSARVIFTSVSASTGNTVFSMLSSRALEAIDSGMDYREAVAGIGGEQIDTDSLIKNYIESTKKAKKRRTVLLIIMAVLLAIALPGSIRSWTQEVNEKITVRMLEERYESAEVIEVRPLYINGERSEYTFIADVGDALIIGGRYRNSEGNWEVATYAHCSYTDLESESKIGYAFNNHDNRALLYFAVYDDYDLDSVINEDDYLLCKAYYVNEHIITVVIDDEVID
ncbi:MAG: hypothetical protein IJD70_00505 [Clostridia bacterium]|nr:hypothetical protein [Clostridia bacterium]